MEKRFDVVVVGNVGVDTNVYLHGRDIDFSVESNFTENLDYVGQAGGCCDIQDVTSPNDSYRRDFLEYAGILFFSSSSLAEAFIETLLNANPTFIVVMGMGSNGCALGTKDGIVYFPAVGMDEPVIDTNGAGDGLAVGFLTSYLLEKYSLEDSITRGQIAARYTCSVRASSSNLISREQLDNYFRGLTAVSRAAA